MRQQLNILKEKLQHQAIVNDQIFRRSMKRNVMSINRRYTFKSASNIPKIPGVRSSSNCFTLCTMY